MDFLTIIKNIAPMIAGTVLGPFGGLAANAILGVIPDANKADAQAALSKGPESFLQHVTDLFQKGVIDAADLKKAEIAHAEKMAELGYKNVSDLAKIDADDRASARAREVQVRDNIPSILAFLVTFGFFGVLSYIIWKGVPIASEGHDAVMMLLGSLATAWTGVVAYYFGSSSGSTKKDATLAEIAKS